MTLKQRIQLRKRTSMELTASIILASLFSTQPPPPTTGATVDATSSDDTSGGSVDVDGVATLPAAAVVAAVSTTANITASPSSSLMQKPRRRGMVGERMLVVSLNSDELGSLKLNEGGNNIAATAIPRTVAGASMGTSSISSTAAPRPPGHMSFPQKVKCCLLLFLFHSHPSLSHTFHQHTFLLPHLRS